MPQPRPSSRRHGGLFLTLAVLALMLRVAVPQGFMLDTRSDAPFPIVICTADGAMTLDASGLGDAHPAPEKSKASDAPCAFAGHGGGLAPPEAEAVGASLPVAYAAPRPKAVIDLIPGRGLSAPPPPARGPPQTI